MDNDAMFPNSRESGVRSRGKYKIGGLEGFKRGFGCVVNILIMLLSMMMGNFMVPFDSAYFKYPIRLVFYTIHHFH